MVKKWANNVSMNYSKDKVQMTNRYMKRSSSSLVIRETLTTIAIRLLLGLVRMAVIQNLKTKQNKNKEQRTNTSKLRAKKKNNNIVLVAK